MMIDTIAARLRNAPGAGPQAARAQFLLWLMAVPEDECPARAAEDALARLGPLAGEGAAIRALAQCLRQVRHGARMPGAQRRRARSLN